MTPAGFNDQLAGYQTATEAETNLISKNDTNGAVIKITGISLYLSETSDAALAKQFGPTHTSTRRSTASISTS